MGAGAAAAPLGPKGAVISGAVQSASAGSTPRAPGVLLGVGRDPGLFEGGRDSGSGASVGGGAGSGYSSGAGAREEERGVRGAGRGAGGVGGQGGRSAAAL